MMLYFKMSRSRPTTGKLAILIFLYYLSLLLYYYYCCHDCFVYTSIPTVNDAQSQTGSGASHRQSSNVNCFSGADCVVICCPLPFVFSLFHRRLWTSCHFSPKRHPPPAPRPLSLTSNSCRSTSSIPPAHLCSTLPSPKPKHQRVVVFHRRLD